MKEGHAQESRKGRSRSSGFRREKVKTLQIYDKGVGGSYGLLADGFGGHLGALLFAICMENPKYNVLTSQVGDSL